MYSLFADRFEEMRPFLFLVFPRWFGKAYPALMERVQTNAARHTTPLDVHTTLLDVLFLNNADTYKKQRQKTKHGISLFQQVGKTEAYNNNNGEFIERFPRFKALYVSITSTSLSRSGNRKCAWRQHFVLLKIGSLTKNNVHVH